MKPNPTFLYLFKSKYKFIQVLFFILSLSHTNISKADDNFDLPLGIHGIYGSPAPVEYQGELYLFNQDRDKTGYIEYRKKEGHSWSIPKRIPNIRTSKSPYAIVYNDLLYVFHEGKNNNGDIWYSTYDGTEWHPEVKMNKVGLSSSPALTVYHDTLYLFFKGRNRSNKIWYTYFDGEHWSKQKKLEHTNLRSSPSAVSFNDNIYLFHNGSINKGKLYYSVFDGTSWSNDSIIPQVSLSESPNAVVYDSLIYIFHQAENESGELMFSTYNGKEFSEDTYIDNVFISESPGAIVYNDELLIFHQYKDYKGYLWGLKKTPTSWTTDKPIVNFSFEDNNLLDKPLSSITIIGTHHSYISAPEFKENNQDESVLYQLNQGVRFIELNMEYGNPSYERGIAININFFPQMGSKDPLQALFEINKWLVENPNEILIIHLNTKVRYDDIKHLFTASGLYQRLYSYIEIDSTDITPRDILNTGKQVLLYGGELREMNSDIDSYFAKSATWEFRDIYSPGNNPVSYFNNPLYLIGMNYIKNIETGVGDKNKAKVVNEYYYLKSYFLDGWRGTLQRPFSFIIDFHNYGDLWEFLNEINTKYNSLKGTAVNNEGNTLEGITYTASYSSDLKEISSKAVSSFDFPVKQNETITITPHLKGYSFKPSSYTYINEDYKDDQFVFKAIEEQKKSTTNYYIEEGINPNPVDNYTIISFNNISTERATLEVFTIKGILIDVQSYNIDIGPQQIKYNTSNLNKGLYLFKFKFGNKYIYEKIVKS